MFTARTFLENAPDVDGYKELPKLLRSDSERLIQEFLDIATSPGERFDFRCRALLVLSRHFTELQACRSAGIVELLKNKFDEEFPLKKLNNIAKEMNNGILLPEGYLAHLFCVIFAQLSPVNSKETINSVREVFKGTSLENILEKQLTIIELKQKGGAS